MTARTLKSRTFGIYDKSRIPWRWFNFSAGAWQRKFTTEAETADRRVAETALDKLDGSATIVTFNDWVPLTKEEWATEVEQLEQSYGQPAKGNNG